MSVKSIKKLSTSQLFELHSKVTGNLIIKIQREYDESTYHVKKPKDKLVCQICGGKYTRQKKSTHESTQMHQRKVKEIYDAVNKIKELTSFNKSKRVK